MCSCIDPMEFTNFSLVGNDTPIEDCLLTKDGSCLLRTTAEETLALFLERLFDFSWMLIESQESLRDWLLARYDT